MDIKHVLSRNPMLPKYLPLALPGSEPTAPATWTAHPGGTVEIGHAGDGFGFDNEFPRHRVHLEPFALADRPVSCGEWMGFIDDGGYQRPELWLSDGWATVEAEGWEATVVLEPAGRPLAGVHTRRRGDGRSLPAGLPHQLLRGGRVCPLGRATPPHRGRVGGGGHRPRRRGTDRTPARHPRPPPVAHAGWQRRAVRRRVAVDLLAYSAYPGFAVESGAVGEYNGKFMVNQYVLRGGSCVTPADHIRSSYRNFFPPSARWAFSGLRLARTA